MNPVPQPPGWARRLLAWLHPAETLEEVQGDLDELFIIWYQQVGRRKASFRYLLSVVSVLPPFVRKRHSKSYYPSPSHLSPDMLRNYLTIAWRNLIKQKAYSFINITGLSVGMAVAMLIGLWIYDELSYDKYHQHYDRIARLMQRFTHDGEVGNGSYMPLPMGDELRTVYGADFQYVVMSSWTGEHILAKGDRKFMVTGNYLSPEAPELFSLKMQKGTRAGLQDPASVLLAASVAEALFGDQDPMDQIIKIDNKLNVKVTGVYEDLPYNTQFRDMKFIAPWALYVASEEWVKRAQDNADWNNNSWEILVQLAPHADMDAVSAKIKDIRARHVPEIAMFNPEAYLHPMRKWHLYTGWDKTGRSDGRIQYVWLFGIIGLFVLLLACINFMNLSTARSEKRSKEVGIRKTMGSVRAQLISQFFSESLLVAVIAFVAALLLVGALLPSFNQLADKQLHLPFANPYFWTAGIVFTLLTGLLAGSYPALYLSSFQPVKVLKGTFRVGRLAAVPRRVLIVVQFTVSVTLIIGTVVVFRQIQHAKNRPMGYSTRGLITITMNTPELYGRYNALREELLATGAVVEMSTSSTPATNLNSTNGGFEWEGKDPNFKESFGTIGVTHDFGKTVGWQFVAGRDFSRAFATDSAGMVLNETGAKYMGLKDPVGKTVKWRGKPFRVVGIIKDMVMGSPFEPIFPTVYMLDYGWANVINIKLNPAFSTQESLAKVEDVFKKFNPGSPFNYKFSDEQYALKFAAEQRIGVLASIFATLAIFISCLGLFGLASFVAEQRTKEIGIRKVLGASVLNLWSLLSKDFVYLVVLAFLIAAPTAYYFLSGWLAKYEYRTQLSPWIFVATGAGALVIALLTVSFQAIKAALRNPVKSLRTE